MRCFGTSRLINLLKIHPLSLKFGFQNYRYPDQYNLGFKESPWNELPSVGQDFFTLSWSVRLWFLYVQWKGLLEPDVRKVVPIYLNYLFLHFMVGTVQRRSIISLQSSSSTQIILTIFVFVWTPLIRCTCCQECSWFFNGILEKLQSDISKFGKLIKSEIEVLTFVPAHLPEKCAKLLHKNEDLLTTIADEPRQLA